MHSRTPPAPPAAGARGAPRGPSCLPFVLAAAALLGAPPALAARGRVSERSERDERDERDAQDERSERDEPVFLGAAARGSLDPAAARLFRASLERALARHGVPILDTAGGTDEDARPALAEAAAHLDEAMAAYGDGDAVAVLEATDAALRSFERGPAFTEDDAAWDLYRDALSLRALVLLEQKRGREADDALRALLVVMPRYAPRRDRAPPELVRHVEDVKDELRSLPPTMLEVLSRPAGATVIVDGRRRGRAPLLVEDLVPGAHFVAVEGQSGRHAERVVIGDEGARVTAKLGSRRGTAAREVVTALSAPITAPAFVEAVGAVDDDALVAVILQAGRKIEVIGARVTSGEVHVVCGVRAENNDNDRERATFVLVEGLLERKADAWLDEAARDGDDPATLRPRLFSGLGSTVADDEEAAPISPAAIAVGVIGGIVAVAALGTGIGVVVSRELKKDEGFTWSVDASGL